MCVRAGMVSPVVAIGTGLKSSGRGRGRGGAAAARGGRNVVPAFSVIDF
jgi:hypothetical protein